MSVELKIVSYQLVVRSGEEDDVIKDLDNYTGENGIGIYNFGAIVRLLNPEEIKEVVEQVPEEIL